MKRRPLFLTIVILLALAMSLFSIYVFLKSDIVTKSILIVTFVTMSAGLIIFVYKGTVTLDQFFVLIAQLLFSALSIPFIQLFYIWFFQDVINWVSYFGVIMAMFSAFITSLIILYWVFHLMNKSFLDGDLNQNALSNLSALTNFLTILITMLLLFNSTFSTEQSNIIINNLENRLDSIESYLIESNNSTNFKVTSSISTEEDNSIYYYMYIAMVVYVLASYYTLYPTVGRRRKNKVIQERETEIVIPPNIIERAEIELLLKSKHAYIQSYNKTKNPK